MINPDRIRERYLKDALPVRLAGLAADLSRVASSARRATGGAAAAAMLEESQYLIEWTAAEAPAEIAEELVNLQVLLALWRRAWPDAQHHLLQRSLLAVQAKQWADQVMRQCENLPAGSNLSESDLPRVGEVIQHAPTQLPATHPDGNNRLQSVASPEPSSAWIARH